MSWQFVLFTKITALKTLVKSVTVCEVSFSGICLCLKRKNTIFL